MIRRDRRVAVVTRYRPSCFLWFNSLAVLSIGKLTDIFVESNLSHLLQIKLS